MKTRLSIVTCAVCIVIIGAAPASKPAPTQSDMTPRVAENTFSEPDVPYVENGSEKQKLDIYAPLDAHNSPVLVFVHGGEWAKGDKSEVSFKPKFFNEYGVIFVAVNYRLSGTDHHPAQVNDVAAAVKYVHDHIHDVGGDPTKIVLMGHSAGCHLVTLVGLDPRPLATVGMKPSDLAGVVSWSGGAFDLVEKEKSGGNYPQCIRANFGDDPAKWRDASPMNHIGDFKPLPRFLFASAEQGNPSSREASDKMAEKIRAAGGKAESIVLKGKSPTLANHQIGMPGDTTGDTLLEFIKKCTSA